MFHPSTLTSSLLQRIARNYVKGNSSLSCLAVPILANLLSKTASRLSSLQCVDPFVAVDACGLHLVPFGPLLLDGPW
jgi:hypothetical protein